MFQPGHKYGNHNNHWRGGRLTKDQYAELSGLVPKAIEVWKKILEMPVTPKGMSVQAETAAKVLLKFAPDLTEITNADENVARLREIAGQIRANMEIIDTRRTGTDDTVVST